MIAANYCMCSDSFSAPPTQFYDLIDYVSWFLSSDSDWMPRKLHAFLLSGMKQWAMWPWQGELSSYTEFRGSEVAGSLTERLHKARSYKTFKLTRAARTDLVERLNFSTRLLALPESGQDLTDRLIHEGFLQAWFEARDERKQQRSGKPKAAT